MVDALARSRPKVAVVAWDVGHNPLGRAAVLAELLARRFDVEIWGAQFARYGSRVWAPLRHSAIPVHGFEGRMLPEHLGVMEDVAGQIDTDAIWVSKPRLPSLALGILAAEAGSRPLVLDVDDDELAFFGQTTGLAVDTLERRRGDLDLTVPFGETWTRACEPLIGAVDPLTVSNVVLQARYGGLIVPHARDEVTFDPPRYDRAETRRRLGIDDSCRLLLFGGTARAHKGVVEVLEALDRLGDDRYRLAVFGTSELGDLHQQFGALDRWLIPLGYQPFDQLPAIVGAADLACVLSDPTNPVSQSQMPAKVTDTLAMGVPCLVAPVPPLRPLIDKDVLHVHAEDEALEDRIAAVFSQPDAALDRARRGHEVFLESYSYGAVREIVEPAFDQVLGAAPGLRPELPALVRVLHRVFPTDGRPGSREAPPAARVPGRRRRPVQRSEQYDLVIFWKQNDTSIYGRRQDMFLKYLERTGRFRTIVHFDNPITPEALVKSYVSARGSTDQRRFVVHQTAARLLHRRDHGRVKSRTFVYGGRRSRHAHLPERTDYVEYVSSVLARNGIGAGGRPTVFWVYPTNDDLPALIDALDPDVVVADVVDDDRALHTASSPHYRRWEAEGSPHYDRIDLNYERVLARSDVVLANSAPVAESMLSFSPEVHVVPNACDLDGATDGSRRPKELRALDGPIIGYVGNLSSRIDIALLEAVARARPGWQLVLVGSAHFDQSVLRLDDLPNVHFVGVKPYAEAQQFVAHFDVALIPHLDNEMTRSMNPLKAYVYLAGGVPIVSTPVANLGELASLITVADGPDEFVSAIEAALQAGKRPPDLDVLRPHSWPARVDEVMQLIDDAMGAPPVEAATGT